MKTKLDSYIKILQGYAFKTENYVEKSNYRLVTLGNFQEGDNCFKYNDDKATYYGADFPQKVILQEGDLILPLTEQVVGLFGNSAFIPHEERFKFVLNQRVGKIVLKNDDIDKYYLHYLLATKEVKKQLEARASGTKQRNISPDDVYDVSVELPNIYTQIRTGNLLYKIEQKQMNNNQINSELESLAKTLYDYWFLQFEFPNAEGKPYKSSGGKMVYNEQLKKEIPEGWEVKEVLDFATWISNSQPPKSQFCYEPKEGYIRFIQNRDYDSDSYKTYIPYKKSLSIVNRFDILMDKYGDAGTIRYGIEGVFNVALGKIEVKDNKHVEYIRSFLGSSNIYTYLHNSCMASTRASLSEENLKFLYLPMPNECLLERYQNMMHNIRETILKNKDENQELIKLRDFLLPLLMNGQVTIKDAEEKVDEVIKTNKDTFDKEKQFELWLQNQGLAARGDVDLQTLREIFDAMDENDK